MLPGEARVLLVETDGVVDRPGLAEQVAHHSVEVVDDA